MKDKSDWISQVKIWIQLPGVRRIVAIVLIVEVLTLALGVAFLLIVHGLFIGFIYLALYWQPAYMLLNRLAGVEGAQSNIVFPRPWWRYLTFSLQLGLRILMVVLGIWILLNNGFCNQNIICILLKDR